MKYLIDGVQFSSPIEIHYRYERFRMSVEKQLDRIVVVVGIGTFPGGRAVRCETASGVAGCAPAAAVRRRCVAALNVKREKNKCVQ